jgi:hypothetical protein
MRVRRAMRMTGLLLDAPSLYFQQRDLLRKVYLRFGATLHPCVAGLHDETVEPIVKAQPNPDYEDRVPH